MTGRTTEYGAVEGPNSVLRLRVERTPGDPSRLRLPSPGTTCDQCSRMMTPCGDFKEDDPVDGPNV